MFLYLKYDFVAPETQAKKKSKFAASRSTCTKNDEERSRCYSNVLKDAEESQSSNSNITSKLEDNVFYPIPKGLIIHLLIVIL